MSAFKLTGQAKIPAVCEFVSTLLDNGCKFLLFAYHLSVLDAVEQLLVKRQRTERQCLGYIRIDGGVDPTQRHNLVNQFQSSEAFRVALLSISAGGHGLTLTAANAVVFAELMWTPSLMQQAEDRAHRIGQTSGVNVYYLHASGTLDE